MKVYARDLPEGEDGSEVPADLAHHFLLALCTHPGQGVCYQDRGWYGRFLGEEDQVDADDLQQADTSTARSKSATAATYNKILGNVLRYLNVNEDPRQYELALRIMKSCPELVAGYVNSVCRKTITAH
jgi:nucleolar pre-ribosomal-associated protein 1